MAAKYEFHELEPEVCETCAEIVASREKWSARLRLSIRNPRHFLINVDAPSAIIRHRHIWPKLPVNTIERTLIYEAHPMRRAWAGRSSVLS